MSLNLLGKKIGMTHIYNDAGDHIPVTVLKVEPHFVTQIKTAEGKDKYDALQLGTFDEKKSRRLNRALQGHFKKSNVEPKRFLAESKGSFEDKKVGDEITVELFEAGEKIVVSGKSKGKGFAGVMKRYNFGGAPASRGTHESFRGGGSIGNAEFPGKVMKGRRMAGRMGTDTITEKSVEVVKVYKEDNVILLKGGIPGARGSMVVLSK
ncbi:MAG: 50S ribosomal protein L3 [Nitrospinae bacterium]|nr:50S ribosomal protein L3 [Nitrospinota bacterium]